MYLYKGDRKMKVSESGYTKDELLDIVDKYLAEQSRRWNLSRKRETACMCTMRKEMNILTSSAASQ